MLKTVSSREFFRLDDWWRSKAALLMGMVYLFTAWFDIRFERFLWLAMLSIVTISGFASFGYLINDFFDRKKDAIAGKKNFLEGKSQVAITFFFALALSLLLLPWFYLPFNGLSIAWIVLEIILFIVYSLPPLRFKERGIPGLIVDALYAHALPVALAAYTFSLASGKSITLFPIMLLVSWQVISGIRNILLHQSNDLEQDKKSGTVNFVAGMYPSPFFTIIRNLMLLELLLSLGFFGMMIAVNSFLAICFCVIIFLSAITFILYGDKGMQLLLESKWKFFPNNIYEKWIPPAILVALSAGDARFIAVLLLHLALFNFDFFIQLRNHGVNPLLSAINAAFYGIIKLLSAVKGVIHIVISSLVNHFIYYCFLLFGVDLKKENASALDYLKKKRRARN